MSEQPVDAVLLVGQLRVVVVVRVNADAVCKRREALLHAKLGADHGGFSAQLLGVQIPLHDLAALGDGAR